MRSLLRLGQPFADLLEPLVDDGAAVLVAQVGEEDAVVAVAGGGEHQHHHGQQGGHTSGCLLLGDFFRQGVHLAVLVLNAERIKEGLEHALLALEQPDLDHLLGHAVVGAHAQLLGDETMLVGPLLALHEHGTQLALGGQGGEHHAVGLAVFFVEIGNNLALQILADGGVELLGGHRVEYWGWLG